MPEKNFQQLKEMALSEGMALFGVADITAARKDFLLPLPIVERFPFALSLGFRLSRTVLATIEGMPNQTYYFHYQRANILLDQTALKLAARIQARGYDAFPIPASQLMDWDKQLGSVNHREIARLAGHGWYGRNNLMVNRTFGSQVRYATVLTDLPLPAGRPVEDGCGECRACLGICPANAINEGSFDREACHQKLKEFTKIQRIGQMICGVCVNACPGTGVPRG